ncbi:MAG: efflux RND transporter periplasmic adaptor subunit [Cyclobacteriaceae bacterium]
MAKQKKKSNKLIYLLIGVTILLIVVLLFARSKGWIGDGNVVEVELANAKKATITEKVSASGTVQPVVEVKLAPEVSGEIIELKVEDGDAVKEGDVLVKIRPDVWLSQLDRSVASLNQQKANVESAKATLSRAEATLKRAEQEFERQKKLWDQRVISEADWQLAQQNVAIARNDLQSSKQSLEAAKYIVRSTEAGVTESQENVRRTIVVAPMTGVISKLNVKQGERVVGTAQMAGTEMLRIADLNVMEVRVDVNENDIVRVHENDTVLIDVDAYSSTDAAFKGIVTNIANTAKEKLSADAITEFEVRILILRSSYEELVKGGNRYPFRPGMTASVEILTSTKENILTVPLGSVTTRNPEKEKAEKEQSRGDERSNNRQVIDESKRSQVKEDMIVVFVNEGGVASMREVKTGISDYDNIEIISGLKENEEVIIGPFLVVSKRLKDGDQVKLMEKKEEDDQ